MQKIVLASGNQGKLKEMNQLLAELNVEIVPQSDFDIPEAIEDGLSFVENSIIKARHAAKLTGLPAIADDSGLAVDFLKGQPGIYSSRFAGEAGNDAANNAKLLELMENVPAAERTARFHCCVVFMRHENDPMPLVCQAAWEGKILPEACGENGFGYDPLFFVASENCASAQLSKERKNQLSHRGLALKELVSRIKL
ncbi:RdgB/HAM1 family non-canonical purine NTP pyrophosphatase [Pelagibaculum spongiae]|uniref:dITP/XTP pyrophosphatase n=1 Tax=Pelagibaculum spongiae TaxID=2080658 RepID=A0A2V1GWP9_9GAMM|nr:RdgB/HAM1 family non-canonical purine NTP pyrophosphatase [Pelagibaculum spongiae]PVZ63579.1 non-canonical purine NTP pyrophosphatase, RdgB/HAM1 family [Pelagibaculum spongiae]